MPTLKVGNRADCVDTTVLAQATLSSRAALQAA